MSKDENAVGDLSPGNEPIHASGQPGSAGRPNVASQTLTAPLAMGFAGLLAGGIVWCIVELSFPLFEVPDELLQKIPLSFPPAELLAEVAAAKQVVNLKNGAAVGLLLGLLATTAFSVAQGAARGFHRSLGQMAMCVVCGGAGGATAGLVSQLWMNHLLSSTEPMTAAVVVQAAFWGILGAGAGVGVGMFSGSVGGFFRLVFQGVLAGAIFGLVYGVAAAFVFPMDDAERLLPASLANRAAWAVVGTAVLGLLLGTSSKQRRPRTS
jgi:hypothetical protein